jgi:hypothetical protein
MNSRSLQLGGIIQPGTTKYLKEALCWSYETQVRCKESDRSRYFWSWTRRSPIWKRGSLRKSRMQVVRGVFRRSERVVNSGFVSQSPAHSSSDETSRFLCLCIHSNAAFENLLNV